MKSNAKRSKARHYDSIPIVASSSPQNTTSGINRGMCRRWTPIVVTIVFLLVGVVWWSNGEFIAKRSSSRVPILESTHGTNAATGGIPRYRPCQFTAKTSSTTSGAKSNGQRPRVIQTHMGDPSSHWSEVPCLKTTTAEEEPSGKKASSSWSLLKEIYHGLGSSNERNVVHETGEKDQIPRRVLHKHKQHHHGKHDIEKENEFQEEYVMPSANIRVGIQKPDKTQNKETKKKKSKRSDNKRPPILGFGGAFTEAAALNYNSLTDAGKEAVMELLFGKSGLGYSLGRVHINSCDFCVESYSLDDQDGDFNLDAFDMSVDHDVQSGMIDMMVQANTMLQKSWPIPGNNEDNGASTMQLKLLASPWSPPSWMKAPRLNVDQIGAEHASNMTGSAQPTCLRDGTGEQSQYAGSWALFFSKFIDAYKEKGLSIWAVTIQNEPEFPAPWEACSYTPDTELDFLQYHLGPRLRADHPNLKILIFDHNKDHAVTWMETLMDSPGAAQYVDGTAVHWYADSMDRLLDGAPGTPNMHRLMGGIISRGAENSHLVLGSESCHCPSTGYAGGDLKVIWDRAERYAHTILADLAAGSNGWIEWNLLLDARGGPNHLGNLCDTSLLAVPHRAKDAPKDLVIGFNSSDKFGAIFGDQRTSEELHALGNPANYLDVGVVVQPMYYYMGHISRYVRPGSRSIDAMVDSSSDDDGCRTFRPKGQTVAGGGINNLARVGMDITVWPCEGSTRQKWKLNDEGQLQLFGHDWLGHPTTTCAGNVIDKDYKGLTLTECNSDDAGKFSIVGNESESKQGVNLVLANGDSGQQSCLSVKPLENNGGAAGLRGGSQVATGNCDEASALWGFSSETGELISRIFDGGEVCMTSGWPFLQVGAFESGGSDTDGSEDIVVVILNEANEGANFVLRDDANEILLTSFIPARGIQTIVL